MVETFVARPLATPALLGCGKTPRRHRRGGQAREGMRPAISALYRARPPAPLDPEYVRYL